MLDKIKAYLKFWNDKPSYHLKSSTYGGFRLDIDQYYEIPENKKELKELNKSNFSEMTQKKESKGKLTT